MQLKCILYLTCAFLGPRGGLGASAREREFEGDLLLCFEKVSSHPPSWSGQITRLRRKREEDCSGVLWVSQKSPKGSIQTTELQVRDWKWERKLRVHGMRSCEHTPHLIQLPFLTAIRDSFRVNIRVNGTGALLTAPRSDYEKVRTS